MRSELLKILKKFKRTLVISFMEEMTISYAVELTKLIDLCKSANKIKDSIVYKIMKKRTNSKDPYACEKSDTGGIIMSIFSHFERNSFKFSRHCIQHVNQFNEKCSIRFQGKNENGPGFVTWYNLFQETC